MRLASKCSCRTLYHFCAQLPTKVVPCKHPLMTVRRGPQQQAQLQRAYRFSTSRCGASQNGVEPPNIRDLARMAQLSVTDEEVKEWEPQLQQIVSWFDQLQAVNVEGVPPAVRADVGEDNVLRPDTPVEYAAREALLNQVPDKEGSFVKVPKIM